MSAHRIETVLGPIAPETLGYCQAHEHVFIEKTPAAQLHPELCIDSREKSLNELLRYRALGGSAIADAQPVEAGRSAEMLAWLSEESGVHIIASTGYHLLQYYSEGREISSEKLYLRWCRELTDGLEGRDGRLPASAGVVKAAIPQEGPHGDYETLLRAAARAAADCGAPLMLHTEKGSRADETVTLCKAEGLDAERILVCHVDRQTADRDMHRRLADMGVYLEYDTIGRYKYHSDEEEAALIADMLDAGYGAQLLLSLDTTRKRLRSYGGEIGLEHLLCSFIPLLRECGVSDDSLRNMTVINPAQAFSRR